MEQYKTLAIFTFQSEYAVLRLLLEHEEIRHIFLNETMIGVLPFHSNAVGGIRLKIHPEDFENAQQILDRWNHSSHLKIV